MNVAPDSSIFLINFLHKMKTRIYNDCLDVFAFVEAFYEKRNLNFEMK